MNFKISVLGEVSAPGTYSVTGDKITILQALALARDLTIYGQRENVQVIREQNGRRQIYQLDLTRSDIFSSPAYYLQQNDVVYVTPSKVRAGQGEINENYFRSGSFWISLASISMTTINFVIALTRLGEKNK
jgi:polysaccharide export outer membrane protein